jgi:hypothetical protein
MEDSHSTRAGSPEGTRSLLGGALRLGGTAAGAAMRPAARGLALGRRVERDVRDRVGRSLGERVLVAVDSVLASDIAAGAVDRVVASPLAERALAGALEGPLVDALARDVVRHAVVERLVDPLLSAEVLETVLERADRANVPQRVTERLLADGVIESAVARVLDGPELERVAAAALESPAAERLVARVIESRLLDEAVVRLLQSDDLWLLVDEIARSPAVTAAITQQSLGFADQVAGGVRARSRSADVWLESAARRALRRGPAGERPPDGQSAP